MKGKRMRTPLMWGVVLTLCVPCPVAVSASNGMNLPASVQAVGQTQKVTGTVLDETGMPMIGVTIQVKGLSMGVITDIDGNFAIDLPEGKNELVISYIGYKTQTVKATVGSPLQISLVPDTEILDEVVVIGYGTVKKRDLTGAVASIKNEDVVMAPTNNVMEALQGKVAGMDIVKSSGQVGEDVNILLRGSRTIYGDNSPLFIIDGIQGDYNQINPADIETIDVLKDASSTAIYGSAGANGVVIITTKRGKEGKATVNLDAYFGFSGTPEYSHGMVGDEWTRYQREAYKYKNGQYPADMSAVLPDAQQLAAYKDGKWIDWVDEAAGNTAITQKYSLSMTAGSEKTKVFSSVTYSNEEGLLSNDNQKKYAMRLNIDQDLASWATMGFTSNLTYTDRNRGTQNTFTRSLSAFPLGDAYDAEGNINYEYSPNEYTPLGDFIPNQYADNTKSTYINVNGYMELTPLEGLSFKSILSASLANSRRGQYWGEECTAHRPTYAGSPHASITNNYDRSYTWENILNYNKTLAQYHQIGATFVTSWTHDQNEMNTPGGSGQQLDQWLYWRLASATSQHIESDFAQTQKMSYAIRANYSYKGKYLLNVSNRWDGVSWLADGHKWDSFPAVAVAWRISDEPFMQSTQKWLSNLKLRLGYGVTGNSGGVGAYSTVFNAMTYTANGVTVDGKIVPFTQYTGNYGNQNLSWEKSYNWNYGVDFGFLNGRIDGSLEYFSTRTKGLLFKRAIPVTGGITQWGSGMTSWENLAETSNRGLELTVNSHNIHSDNFNWNSTLSFTWGKEEIVSLPDGDLISEGLFEGEAISSFYDYKYAGIWGTDTPADVLDAYGVKPGFIKVETNEKNGDGGVHKYSIDDRRILGHANPDVIVGLNNTFTLYDFDFSMFIMARYGQTIKSSLLGWYTAKSDATINQPAGVDYWTESNQSAYYPVPGSYDEQSSIMPSLSYRDGSFIKVKNITVGYTLPLQISRKFLMEKCRIYATAYNPFLYVKDKELRGTDPETGGIDSFPLYRQFVFGVNLTF